MLACVIATWNVAAGVCLLCNGTKFRVDVSYSHFLRYRLNSFVLMRMQVPSPRIYWARFLLKGV